MATKKIISFSEYKNQLGYTMSDKEAWAKKNEMIDDINNIIRDKTAEREESEPAFVEKWGDMFPNVIAHLEYFGFWSYLKSWKKNINDSLCADLTELNHDSKFWWNSRSREFCRVSK